MDKVGARLGSLIVADGDNIISNWQASIEEPSEHRSCDRFVAYPAVLDRWVFEPVWDLLRATDPTVEDPGTACLTAGGQPDFDVR